METLEYNITINAPKQKVWETMLNLTTYKEWVSAAWPGSSYIGEWKQGADLRFVGTDGGGTLANLEKYQPFDYVLAKHIAILLKGGVEDKESDMAKGWIGTTESYSFIEKNGKTELKVLLNIKPEWAEMFNDGWPKALDKLKEISEN